MALMSLRSRSHIKVSVVLTRANHLFIHNYIRYKKEVYSTTYIYIYIYCYVNIIMVITLWLL